jgi:diguanylate cyclase
MTGVLALDLDHFKRVNDTYGHSAGDRVLCQVAEVLRSEVRGDDEAFRLGGEEMLVLLTHCDLEGALRTADRIRARIERLVVTAGGQRISVTVSIGVALWGGGSSFETAQDSADEALYVAKERGRNRCVAA